MKFNLGLTEPQEEFVFSDAAHPAMVAGLGAGKSHAAIVRLYLLMLDNYKQTKSSINTLMTMPTYDLLRLRAMPGLESLLCEMGVSHAINKSEYSIEIGKIGKMLFRSYDNPQRIVAFECAHSICDELDTLTKEKAEMVWRKVSERTRQKTHRANTVAAVTTPDQGTNGFIYSKWVKQRQPGYELIKASTRSNPCLPDGYIEQILANYDPLLAQLYIEGEFVNLTANKVYHFYNRAKHHSDRVIQAGDRLFIGVDFNVGGCCANTWVIEKGYPVAVDEFVSYDTQDFINNLSRYKDHKITIYPDASGDNRHTNAAHSDVSLIKSGGYDVGSPKSNPAVRDRINSFNALLAHDHIKVNSDKCPELANALESQGYDKKGNPEKFDEHPAIDDHNDSAGYFIHARYPIIKPGHGGIRVGR